MGKRAFILDNPDITKRYAQMITPCYPPDNYTPRYIVAVDLAEEKLFTENAETYKDRVDLVIDHHPSNEKYGKGNLVRPEAGACAEIVYDVLVALGVRMTPDIAECIYVGASTDTGCFKFSNTTAHTHEVAAACLKAGIDGGEINRRLFETKTFPRFQMERIIMDTMEFSENGAIALAMIWLRDKKKVGADKDDLDAISSLTRQVEGVKVGLTLTEHGDGTARLSVRTTKEVDASEICRRFGGGGHKRAAGASIECGMDEARERVLEAAREVYHAAV